ncbi:hypothetical protein BC831DRAFT_283377 [Entophlyctis helioformis]|nr:hypothetical protein BC831DRAFT_283377 [Entophlyctis helioformis]
MSMRPQCWFRYSGAEALSLQEPGLYTMLCFREAQDVRHGYDKTTNPILEFVEVIDRDLYRTFPNNERFVARQTPARQPQPPIVSRSASQHSQPDTQCMPSRESHAQQPQDDSDKQSQSDMLSDYLDRRRGSSASAFMASAAAAAASLGMRLFEGLSSNTSLGSNTSSRASDASGSSSGSSSSTSAGSDAPDARTSTSSADSDGISSFSSDGSASSCSSVASSSSSSPVGSAPQSPQRACPAPANGRSEFSLAGAGHIFSAERCAGSDVDNADARASTLPRESIGLPSIALECNPYLLALRRVLVCFAYYSWPHPDESRAPSRTCSYNVGYCQSLNFIVGLLLLVFVDADPSLRTAFESDDQDARMDVETRVFWMLVAIVECLLPPETYGNTLEGSQIQQEILWSWILRKKGAKFGLEACSKWLDQLSSDSPDARRAAYARQTDSSMGDLEMLVQTAASRAPVLSMVTTPWFMALFVNTMPTETVLRIWDCFFYQGEKILFRVVLTLLSMHEDKLIVCSDFSDAWNMLRDLPKDTIDCEEFMKNCFKPRVVINPFGSGSRPSSPRLTRFPHGVPSSPLSLSPATPVEEAVSQARAQSSAPVVSVTMPPPQPALQHNSRLAQTRLCLTFSSRAHRSAHQPDTSNRCHVRQRLCSRHRPPCRHHATMSSMYSHFTRPISPTRIPPNTALQQATPRVVE